MKTSKIRPAKKAELIKSTPHRTKLGNIDEFVTKALAGENVDKLLSFLSDDDRLLFNQVVQDLRTHGTCTELDDLWRLDYTRRPPTMEEFINDDYWMGQVLKPSEETQGLFPVWKEVLCRDFNIGSRVHNVVITGSLGIGKSYVLAVIFLYRIVCARLLRNAQAFFNLGKGSTISYVILSVTKTTVADTVFGDVKNFMGLSPFFIEECGFNPDMQYASLKVPLGNNICLSAGSKGWHIIGRNAMGVALDEGNFRQEANPDMKAFKLYDEARTRIQNRFQRVAGFLPAISIVASSARHESSFTEQVIGEIEKAKDPTTQRVYRYAIYEIRKDQMKLSGRWFKVAYGLRNIPPVVLGGWYDEKGVALDAAECSHEAAPIGTKVKLVPDIYHEAFLRNVYTALQSICGVSTGGTDRWFSSTVDVEKCFDLAKEEGVVNPAKLDIIPISEENDDEIWDYLEHRRFLTRVGGQVQPRRHPGAMRFGHIDLATQSLAGVGICHIAGDRLVEGLVKDGRVFAEHRIVVEYDFILTISAGKTKPISIEKIQKFFFWLRNQCGYSFGLVTADQFNSAMPLQMMEARGFKTHHLSVDSKKDQYLAWRNAFEELRLRPYRQFQLEREIGELMDTGKKVDHPEGGCFIGETKVALLDGTTRSIGDLVGQGTFWLYASDDKGNAVPGKGKARLTKTVTQLAHVTLDNGCVEVCTTDHRWRLKNGEYAEAHLLKPGDRLMTLYRCVQNVKRIHHGSTKHAENLKRMLEVRMAKEDVIAKEKVDAAGVKTPKEAKQKLGGGLHSWERRFSLWGYLNHKVKKVEIITTGQPVSVYDIEVDYWNNFALASGVYVHNSKDTCDGSCGCYWNAITAKDIGTSPYADNPGIISDKDDNFLSVTPPPVTINIGTAQQIKTFYS